jgi:diguanylate cyclase (GGDEF)-like protein
MHTSALEWASPDTLTLPPFTGDDEEITQVDLELASPGPVAPTRERHVMMRLDGTDAGQSTRVTNTPLLVGRSPNSDLLISDRSVSREHARLVLTEAGVACVDLESRFGTFHNGQPRHQFIVRPGDLVQFGQLARFVLSLLSPAEEQVLRQMRESSVRDALTMAYTRQYFEQRLASECSHAQRHGDSLALVLLDLDRFKQVNDRYGHQAGDAVLRHVTGVVQQRLRSSDVFARYGGEEFVIILRGTNIEGARRVGERVRAAIAATPVYYCGHAIPVTVSAGCAQLDAGAPSCGEALVAEADRRLYAAKVAGRNRVVWFDGRES